jgi:hypothetical protein
LTNTLIKLIDTTLSTHFTTRERERERERDTHSIRGIHTPIIRISYPLRYKYASPEPIVLCKSFIEIINSFFEKN